MDRPSGHHPKGFPPPKIVYAFILPQSIVMLVKSLANLTGWRVLDTSDVISSFF